jgi:hypothetical protein
MIGFNVQADVDARRMAEKEGVEIRLYEIIYRMTEDIEKRSRYARAQTSWKRPSDAPQVLQVFTASKFGRVAGCRYRRRTEDAVRRYASIAVQILSTKAISPPCVMKRKMSKRSARDLNAASASKASRHPTRRHAGLLHRGINHSIPYLARGGVKMVCVI